MAELALEAGLDTVRVEFRLSDIDAGNYNASGSRQFCVLVLLPFGSAHTLPFRSHRN